MCTYESYGLADVEYACRGGRDGPRAAAGSESHGTGHPRGAAGRPVETMYVACVARVVYGHWASYRVFARGRCARQCLVIVSI
jgi:hypothetical protein